MPTKCVCTFPNTLPILGLARRRKDRRTGITAIETSLLYIIYLSSNAKENIEMVLIFFIYFTHNLLFTYDGCVDLEKQPRKFVCSKMFSIV